MRGLVFSKCLASWSLFKGSTEPRIKPGDLVKFAGFLLTKAVPCNGAGDIRFVRFSDWVSGPYEHAKALRWLRLTKAIRSGRVTLYSTVDDPTQAGRPLPQGEGPPGVL